MKSWMIEAVFIILTSKRIILIIGLTLLCHFGVYLWFDYHANSIELNDKYPSLQEALANRLLRHSNKVGNTILIAGLFAVVKRFRKEKRKFYL
jgi:hypothetical protein